MFDFYKDKTVFVTGHTGFKGSWMCKILHYLGANVVGYSLKPEEELSLFGLAHIKDCMKSYIGDIRNYHKLREVFEKERPEIVFHMAAQPLVRESYQNPQETYEINLMGTVHILECCRKSETVKSFLNVTTDKVYLNKEWRWGYRENERLDGYDPYSNSKSCSELISWCYDRSFFYLSDHIRLSTARAGNVIGGGDFSKDRILPDCVKAALEKQPIFVRNPNSVRPYQHVLEALSAYLIIAEMQVQDQKYSGAYNVGPNEEDCVSTKTLVELFLKYWDGECSWYTEKLNAPHEANFLRLDNSKIKEKFHWTPTWNVEEAVNKTVEWVKGWNTGKDVAEIMDVQIAEFMEMEKNKYD